MDQTTDDLTQSIKSIIDIAKMRFDLANRSFEEGNKFEFETCNLILKGTAGAFLIYLTAVHYQKTEFTPWPLILWGLSLISGVSHQLWWSRVMSKKGKEEFRAASRILSDMTSPEIGPQKLLKKMQDEELLLYNMSQRRQKIQKADFHYITLPESYFPRLIVLQLIFVIIGALAAFGTFHVLWHLLSSFLLSSFKWS